MQTRKWAGACAGLLSVAGIGVSYYLFARGNKLASGQAGSDFCNSLFDHSCDATLTSEYGHALGLSLGGWGVLYFGVLGSLILLGLWHRAVLLRPALSVALLVNFIGLVVSGYLSTLFISGKVPLCPFCLVTHAINFFLFISLLLYRGESPSTAIADIRRGLARVLLPGGSSSPEHSARALGFLAILLLAVALYLGLALQNTPSKPILAEITTAPEPVGTEVQANGPSGADQVLRNIIQAYLDQDAVDFPIDPGDARQGPADAPIQLVVFSDFECPSCKSQNKLLERLAQSYSGRISIVAKNFPLNSECNPLIAAQPHKNACTAAYAAWAAQQQGQYWPYHDQIYHLKVTPTTEVLTALAQKSGLDVQKFLADLSSQAAKDYVKRDVDLALQLKVIQTPTTYLNGRLLTAETGPQLPILIRLILEADAKKKADAAQP